MDKGLEKKIWSDSLEGLNLHDRIEDKIDDLENRSSETIAAADYSVDSLSLSQELESLDELKHNIQKNIDNKDILSQDISKIQEEKRTVKTNNKNKKYNSLNSSIQDSIKNNSEDERSILGREEAYSTVESFTNSIKNETGFFGKLVKMLS